MKKILAFFTEPIDGDFSPDGCKSLDTRINRLNKRYGMDFNHIRYMQQIHSNNVEIVDEVSPKQIASCDALITNKSNIPLLVYVADCIPIIFYDTKKEVIAVAHAGREGTLKKIALKTIKKMKETYQSKAKNINVILGPSIHACCYEVSEDILKEVENKYGKKYINGKNIDLVEINRKQLLSIGIKKKNLFVHKDCTKCSDKNYYSYRKNKTTKRFAGIITIKE